MQPQTAELLERLHAAPWFANVGQPLQQSNVLPVHSWEAAIAHSLSDDWENATLDMRNELCETFEVRYAVEHGADASSELWDAACVEIRPKCKTLIAAKITILAKSQPLPARFGDDIRWNVLGACLELEFREWVKMGAFSNLVEWYIRGHFPCGMDGEYPTGKLIIY